jgi:hypothetical protein
LRGDQKTREFNVFTCFKRSASGVILGGDVGEVGDFLSLLFFPSRAPALREF